MLTTDFAYTDAVKKYEAIAEFRTKVEALGKELTGMVIDGTLPETDADIAYRSLMDWLSDRESDWGLDDLREQIERYEEAA
jgi:hypothetical protein